MAMPARVIPITSARKRSKNSRIRRINKKKWREEREKFFKRNVKYAAAAQALRRALGLSQSELARYMRKSVQAIGNRESGKYAWQGGDDELEQYCHACMLLSKRYG
jgi:DNA-binding transcriptional regulator YiaG